jgi:segregation and condensation protein B
MTASAVETVEALLFVADSPASLESLARAAGFTEAQVEQAIEILKERYDQGGALQVIQIAGGYQICTKSDFAEVIGNFLKPQRQKLSRSLMEVLAIVAYRQPITTADIEMVRGVQCDYGIHGLLERRLIREVGRKQAPGRPVLYGTTQQFLHQFNMNDISQLPKLSDGTIPIAEKSPTLFDEA